MPRPLSELRVRATAHAGDHRLLLQCEEILEDIAEGKISPTKAYNLVYMETACRECAKCARWLAIIARDYGIDKAKEVLELMW